MLKMDGSVGNIYRTLLPVKPGRKLQKAFAPHQLCS